MDVVDQVSGKNAFSDRRLCASEGYEKWASQPFLMLLKVPWPIGTMSTPKPLITRVSVSTSSASRPSTSNGTPFPITLRRPANLSMTQSNEVGSSLQLDSSWWQHAIFPFTFLLNEATTRFANGQVYLRVKTGAMASCPWLKSEVRVFQSNRLTYASVSV